MAQRDVLTANRDKRVWAVAQGKDLKVEDNICRRSPKSKTNDPGPMPDASWPWPGGEEAIKKMTLGKTCKINLFASEEQFPELVNPVQMAWDTKGRLWVAAWQNYPERTPTSTVGDSILIFEDTKGTGHADKGTHFIDGLNCADRLPVLQGRHPAHAGAGPLVCPRQQGRRPRRHRSSAC